MYFRKIIRNGSVRNYIKCKDVLEFFLFIFQMSKPPIRNWDFEKFLSEKWKWLVKDYYACDLRDAYCHVTLKCFLDKFHGTELFSWLISFALSDLRWFIRCLCFMNFFLIPFKNQRKLYSRRNKDIEIPWQHTGTDRQKLTCSLFMMKTSGVLLCNLFRDDI